MESVALESELRSGQGDIMTRIQNSNHTWPSIVVAPPLTTFYFTEIVYWLRHASNNYNYGGSMLSK